MTDITRQAIRETLWNWLPVTAGESWLGGFRWYRRWRGGRWELWYVDICASFIWHHVREDSDLTDWRPPCSHGHYKIAEEWTQK